MKHVYLVIYNAGVLGVYRSYTEAHNWARTFACYDYKGVQVMKYPIL